MRTIELTRDEGEMLVDLIDKHGRHDGRLVEVAASIRQKFGMIAYEREYPAKFIGCSCKTDRRQSGSICLNCHKPIPSGD